MTTFDIYRILFNAGSYLNIMYSNIFENFRLRREKLWPYMDPTYIP